MAHFLMTFFGDLIANDGERLERVTLAHMAGIDVLYDFEPPTEVDLDSRFEAFLSRQCSRAYKTVLPGIGPITADFDPSSSQVSFSKDGLYLCAQPDGQLTCDRPWRAAWETFLVVSEESVMQLLALLHQRWIVKSTRRLLNPQDISLGAGPALLCHEIRLPLRYNLPFDSQSFPFRFPVYADGWRVEELLMYDPLAFYIGKGSNTVAELLMSIDSLVNIAKYDGKILLYTDASRTDIERVIPSFPRQDLIVSEHSADDWISFVSGRFSILSEPIARECAPLAYFDTDILFNAPAQDLFVAMACAGRPTAALEHFSKLSTAPSAGSQLLQEDNAPIFGGCGFNFGTFGIPNLREHGHVLRVIRAVLRNYLDLHGRTSLIWLDQAAANYVSYKYYGFDTSDLTRRIRFAWYDDALKLGPLSGLVHFFGISRKERLVPMRHYLDLLKAHYGIN